MLWNPLGETPEVERWNDFQGKGSEVNSVPVRTLMIDLKECVVCHTDYNPDIERVLPQPPQTVAASPTVSPRDGTERRDATSSNSEVCRKFTNMETTSNKMLRLLPFTILSKL